MKLPSPVRRKHSRIEIIPLIDIMFFLLASFMMVSLQLDRTQNIKVNLPAAAQAQHDFKPDMLNIAVDKAGAVWLEKKQLTLPQLATVMSNQFRSDTNLPVYISGDRDTLHGAMADVLQVVHDAGVQKVAFMVGDESQNEQHAMKIRSPLVCRKTRLEIIPLIDIMFFLLASFMMVSLQMQKVRTLKAALPRATLATAATKPNTINLSVDRFGQVAVDRKALSFADLFTLLTNRCGADPNVPVFIAGSRDATHGSMMYVLDFVKQAGVQRVAISVKAEEAQP